MHIFAVHCYLSVSTDSVGRSGWRTCKGTPPVQLKVRHPYNCTVQGTTDESTVSECVTWAIKSASRKMPVLCGFVGWTTVDLCYGGLALSQCTEAIENSCHTLTVTNP